MAYRRSFLAMRTFISEKKFSAFEAAKASEIRMPTIILVNPFLDANVGSVSRAMLNFGLHDLRIVSPRCDILSETARTLAVGSVELLENAKVFDTLEECIADLDKVVATTARPRTLNIEVETTNNAVYEFIREDNLYKVGIMFGRERDGLNNEEMALADTRVVIPTFKHYESLNLAQAVNIVAYECWGRRLKLTGGEDGIYKEQTTKRVKTQQKFKRASRQDLTPFLDRLEVALDVEKGDLSSENRDFEAKEEEGVETEIEGELGTGAELNKGFTSKFTKNDVGNIRTILQRAQLTKGEVSLLHGILTTLTREKNN